jgi:hypothetical protein
MKIANIILALSLTVASIPAVLPTKAEAAEFACFNSKGGTIFVREKLYQTNIQYLKSHPYLTLEQVNNYKLFASVKNRFPYCLNQSNTFAEFNRVIKKNFDYVYTAKYAQVFYQKENGQTLKLYNTRLVVTVKFQKASPAIIEVTTQYQPPLVNGG